MEIAWILHDVVQKDRFPSTCISLNASIDQRRAGSQMLLPDHRTFFLRVNAYQSRMFQKTGQLFVPPSAIAGGFWDFVLPWIILLSALAPLIRTPARAVYTSHLPKNLQGTMQGISEAFFSLANFVGPILGSHVSGEFGLSGLRWLMVVLVLLEFGLMMIGFKRLVPGAEV